ncbi:MAG: NAD(P)H-hydrate dehydratase, partial [Chloroflexota bacterium]
DEIALTLVDAAEVRARLPQRPRDSHKGTFGKAMVVAGSLNYTGAAYLAAAAAYRAGAGLVTVGAPQIIVPVLAGMLPEATWLLLPHDLGVINEAAVKVLRTELAGYSALLLGPGFGREDVTGEFLRELLRPQEEVRHSRAIGFVPNEPAGETARPATDLPPLVIDADGLNLLAAMDDWPRLLPPGTILTPHPGEFARLARLEREDVQANRIPLAQAKAAEWNCVVVLKGAFTVVAAPDGRTAVEPFATSALASAGTGDVLAGAIAGLLAQGLAPFDAALCAGWLHGMAGVRAAGLLETAISVTAGDVLELLPDALALAART